MNVGDVIVKVREEVNDLVKIAVTPGSPFINMD